MYNNNVRLARKIAIGTIISGIIFLAAFYFTYDRSYVYGGVFFGLGVAAIVITIMISGLIASSRQNHKPVEKTKTLFWNIVSIASIIIYTIIGLYLMNSAKIIVKNNLVNEVDNVYITGCQEIEIGEIKSNSSTSILVNYAKNNSKDCTIGIKYTTPNSLEEELLIINAKPFQGEKLVYEIK